MTTDHAQNILHEISKFYSSIPSPKYRTRRIRCPEGKIRTTARSER